MRLGLVALLIMAVTALVPATHQCYVASAGSVGSYCLQTPVNLSEVVSVGNETFKVRVSVTQEVLSDSVNVTVYVIIEGVGEIKYLTYTPPLFDFVVITDSGAVRRWSSGKVFTQVVLRKELPVSGAESMVVEGRCVRAVAVLIKSLRYLRVVAAAPHYFLTILKAPLRASTVLGAASTTSNATPRSVPQCTVAVIPAPRVTTATTTTLTTTTAVKRGEEGTYGAAKVAKPTTTTVAEVTKTLKAKIMTTSSPVCNESVCRAPTPTEGLLGVKSVSSVSTVTKTTTTTLSTAHTTTQRLVPTTEHGGAIVIRRLAATAAAAIAALVVAVTAYLLLSRR